MAGMASSTEDARKHYEQRVVALQNEAFDQAIAEFTEAIRLDPKNTDAYYGRASCFASKEDYEKAAVDYSQIIKINARDATAYGGRGAAYDDMGEDDKALADFNKAIQLNPKDNHIYYNRALLYARRNDHDKAIADFSEAIRLDPNDNRSYYCRANSSVIGYSLCVSVRRYFRLPQVGRNRLPPRDGQREAPSSASVGESDETTPQLAHSGHGLRDRHVSGSQPGFRRRSASGEISVGGKIGRGREGPARSTQGISQGRSGSFRSGDGAIPPDF
jgi:tetratricopeptide (TPR) repeat protein